MGLVTYIEDTYGDTKGDVYKTFVERFQDRLLPNGFLGIISNRTGFFLRRSSDWRTRVLLRLYRPLLFVDLGAGVLDALVETAAYVLRSINGKEMQDLTLRLSRALKSMLDAELSTFSLSSYQNQRGGLKRHQAKQELLWLQSAGFISNALGSSNKFVINSSLVREVNDVTPVEYPPLTCFRLLGEERKDALLLDSIANTSDPRRFTVYPEEFSYVPDTPFCYWVSNEVRHQFKALSPFQEISDRICVGLSTKLDIGEKSRIT